MDEIWLENQAKQEGQDGEVDQAMIDSLAADLAAAINGTYMKKIKVESELIESDLELEVQSSLSDQDLTINENVNITEDSFNSETLSPLSSEKILKLEHLNNSFSVLPKQSPSNEDFSCWQPTKIAMDKELLRLLGDPSSCSFKVYIGKYKFRCHLHVLQSHSYFLRYKRVDTLSVHLPIKMVTPTAFKVLYNWMLGIKGERKKKERPKGCNIVELYSAVSFLKVNELQEFSYICFNDGCNFGSLAFRLFLEAQKFEIPMIQTLTLSRIQEFFLPLVASKEFLELDFYWLQKLLNMNNVGVNSEIEFAGSVIIGRLGRI
ncbi:uncharacterized protein LOC108039832 isoform X2 [Drosophila rhopaloa]|uniref:Uncharacterized protein LOC108039832 isoform X2 n=1 Tax=Drosophila rhopaloa TaxID=1041015 RepID=A0A6P4EB90_DRORH|nr:uncharacterized protein LOC108039832 isoform X2 [Drosophila rhopaloa]